MPESFSREEMLEAIFNQSSSAIALTDRATGRMIDVNETWVRLTGVEREAAIGWSALELGVWTRAADREACFAALDKVGRVDGLETTMAMRGREVPMLVSATLIPFRGESFVVWELRDISGLRRAQAERERLSGQLLQSQKLESVGRLAGGVAHDFNNMLQAILGNANMAMGCIPAGSPARENLIEIEKCARRSANLTAQMLAFARRQPAAPQVLDLGAAVGRTLKMLKRLIGEDISLDWQPAGAPSLVKIDPGQLDQVLANLCLNARDAIAGAGRIVLRTENISIDPAASQARGGLACGDYVLLTVADNGRGMSEEATVHVFEPFYTTKDMEKGKGLGLATVHGIVNQNNGHIAAASRPGAGTTFSIYWPRCSAEAAVAGPADPEKPSGWSPGAVLLVEDEPAILKIGQQILERLGYAVLAASRPSTALRLARESAGPIDLLITDVVMPEMNGRDLADRIREIHPEIACLYISGYASDVIVSKGVINEGINFLPKPFTMSALAEKVRTVLADRAEQQPQI